MIDKSSTFNRDEFRKSSFSDNDGGACVEVARHRTTVAIRDSKIDFDGPANAMLRIDAHGFAQLLATLGRRT
ncbi:MAG: DUF397 domain-containing protein [Actinomycetota bacterium]|nr:DUF397 domain-containing protein [Actinomycetota bacterium]